MIPGKFIVKAEAVRTGAHQPHSDFILIFRKLFPDHFLPICFIICPAKFHSGHTVFFLLFLCGCGLGCGCFLPFCQAQVSVRLQLLILQILSQGTLHDLHAFFKQLPGPLQAAVVILAHTQRGKCRTVMGIIAPALLKAGNCPPCILFRLGETFRLDKRVGQICQTDCDLKTRLVGGRDLKRPLLHPKGLLRIAHLLHQKTHIVQKTGIPHVRLRQRITIDRFRLPIGRERLLQPSDGSIGVGDIQKRGGVGNGSLQSHSEGCLTGFTADLFQLLHLRGLPVIADQFVEDLQAKSLIPASLRTLQFVQHICFRI